MAFNAGGTKTAPSIRRVIAAIQRVCLRKELGDGQKTASYADISLRLAAAIRNETYSRMDVFKLDSQLFDQANKTVAEERAALMRTPAGMNTLARTLLSVIKTGVHGQADISAWNMLQNDVKNPNFWNALTPDNQAKVTAALDVRPPSQGKYLEKKHSA